MSTGIYACTIDDEMDLRMIPGASIADLKAQHIIIIDIPGRTDVHKSNRDFPWDDQSR